MSDATADALTYAALFPRVYLAFHRRDGKRRELSGSSRAVLLHLAHTGPVTIGELAKHLKRAQSVTSEIVDQLERNGLLSRMRDAQDKRRVEVWLTERGQHELADAQQVLSIQHLQRAIAAMPARDRAALLRGTRALVETTQRRRS